MTVSFRCAVIYVGCVRISFEEKMQVVHQFMFENKLGKGLLQRVDHYFTLLWQQFRYIFYHQIIPSSPQQTSISRQV